MARYKHARPFDIVRTVQTVQKQTKASAIQFNAALPVPAVIDPSYTTGSPNAFINGSTVLTGPYSVLDSYVPTASDTILALPVQGTYIILGHYGAPRAFSGVATGQTVSSTGAVVIAGMSGFPVEAIAYRISGMVFGTQGGTAATQAIRINGPAVSQLRITYNSIEITTPGGNNTGVVSTINADLTIPSFPSTATFYTKFEGTVIFSAAGICDVTARCVTSGADTWTVGSGSFVDIASAFA